MTCKLLTYKPLCFQSAVRGVARLMACALLALLVACGGAGPLEQKMRQAVDDPALRNEQTFNEMTALILADPDEYKEFLTADGQVDIAKLQQAIDRMGRRHDPNFKWDLSAYGGVINGPLRLRLMLERSGSMTGYDARSGNGDFKRAVGEMLTRFPGSDKEVFIVNDGVYPYRGTLESFVQDKDIFTSTKGVGDPSYTDFGAIFDFALTDSVPERVTVLVTDMIYSPRDTEGVSAAKIFNEEGTLATTLFTAHKDKSVIVVKLSGDFHGTYYPYSQPAGVKYDGARPYYMIITGSAAAMQKLRATADYASFADFKTLPGYQADYFFNRNPLPIGYYSLMPRGKGNLGSYSLDGEEADNGIHTLADVKGDKGNGQYSFRVAVDLSQVPATADYLVDKQNYEVDGGLTIDKVEAVTPGMIDARTKRYLERATHLFTLRGDAKSRPAQSTVSLKNRMPGWVERSDAASDLNTRGDAFGTTTFGLLPFMQGIYSAYYGTASTPDFTSFTIRFK